MTHAHNDSCCASHNARNAWSRLAMRARQHESVALHMARLIQKAAMLHIARHTDDACTMPRVALLALHAFALHARPGLRNDSCSCAQRLVLLLALRASTHARNKSCSASHIARNAWSRLAMSARQHESLNLWHHSWLIQRAARTHLSQLTCGIVDETF
jgi:hypothetical protein